MTVAMAVMSILTVLVMSGMNHILNSDMQTEAVRNSSDQVDFAFLTLDSEVRYASAVWAVNQVTTGGHTDYNVEFETQSNVTTSTTPNCTELQYNYATGQLLQATWPDTQTSSSTAPGFEVLASGLSTSVSASPFTINPVTSNYKKVQLMVTLSATAGTGTAHETASSSVTFTAVNTTSTAVAVTADCDPTGWGY
jgi:hypothetical protein